MESKFAETFAENYVLTAYLTCQIHLWTALLISWPRTVSHLHDSWLWKPGKKVFCFETVILAETSLFPFDIQSLDPPKCVFPGKHWFFEHQYNSLFNCSLNKIDDSWKRLHVGDQFVLHRFLNTSPKDPDPSLLLMSKHWSKYRSLLLSSYFGLSIACKNWRKTWTHSTDSPRKKRWPSSETSQNVISHSLPEKTSQENMEQHILLSSTVFSEV